MLSVMRPTFIFLLCSANVFCAAFHESAVVDKGDVVRLLYDYASNDAANACDMCIVLVQSVQQLVSRGETNNQIFDFFRQACKTVHVTMPHLCDHLIDIWGDELIFVFNHTHYQPDNICNTFIKSCGPTNNPLQTLWNITVPGNKPPVKPWPTVPKGKPTLRVLHLSDIHIDANYSIGSEADCPYEWFNICCRANLDASTASGNTTVKTPSGVWGMPNHCDIPFQTFENAIEHIAATERNLDYIIITGDLEAHDMFDYSREYTDGRIKYVNDFLKKKFGNVRIYNSVGNHEGFPGDAMGPHSMLEYSTRGPGWLYESLAKNWRQWLPEDSMADVKYRASYAVRPYKGLKLISLNSIYCSHFNFYLYLNLTDPDDTLQWLITHLLESEKLGEKVHIISHIPSGSDYCLKGWAHNMYEIVNRFENTIAGQFYGHTHQDHFQVYYENANVHGRPTHVNMIGPSLTTYAYNNPAYRVYTIDGNYEGSTFTTLDYETYYTNLTEANMNGQPTWKHEYSMKETFGMKDLSPAAFNNLIDKMENSIELFEKYYIFYRRNDQYEMECVKKAKCRKTYTCATRSARSYDKATFCS